ncbi:MAG: PilZ domain-containing protein [Myxococcota bacterium]|jgi:Tfp pilus assembly protein PilZ|nr:PilZ domain-containing protein [Myxococcota bacterium]
MSQLPQSPSVATLLLETGDVRCVVHECAAQQITIVVEGHVPENETYRLAIYHSGRASGLIRLLCKVVQVKTSGSQTSLQLRILALHSTSGKHAIRDFLQEGLGTAEPDEEAFEDGAGGCFYSCTEPRPRPSVQRPRVRRSTGEAKAERTERRIVVRVGVHFRLGDETYAGQAYNVSHNGVYIISDDILPEEGAPVEVAFPVALHAKPFTIYLRGEVVWLMPGMSTRQGGGVGIRVDTIEDGAGGMAWTEYVNREAEFGASG